MMHERSEQITQYKIAIAGARYISFSNGLFLSQHKLHRKISQKWVWKK